MAVRHGLAIITISTAVVAQQTPQPHRAEDGVTLNDDGPPQSSR